MGRTINVNPCCKVHFIYHHVEPHKSNSYSNFWVAVNQRLSTSNPLLDRREHTNWCNAQTQHNGNRIAVKLWNTFSLSLCQNIYQFVSQRSGWSHCQAACNLGRCPKLRYYFAFRYEIRGLLKKLVLACHRYKKNCLPSGIKSTVITALCTRMTEFLFLNAVQSFLNLMPLS